MDNSENNTLFPKSRKSFRKNSERDHNLTPSDNDEDDDNEGSTENSKNDFDSSPYAALFTFNEKHTTSPILLVTLVVVVAVLIGVLVLPISQNVNKPKIDLKAAEESIKKESIDIWNSLSAVVDDVLRQSSKLGVFLFLYTEKSGRLKETIEPVINYTCAKLDTHEHVEIEDQEFHTEDAHKDFGHLLVKYKPELKQKKVMVVKNLQNIPPKVAQIFHTFCDEINPQVHPAIFIFTLKVDSLEGNENSIADEVFERIWKDLGTDKLSALIARIRNSVFKIH